MSVSNDPLAPLEAALTFSTYVGGAGFPGGERIALAARVRELLRPAPGEPRGAVVRHQLAGYCLGLGERGQAEALWRRVLDEWPGFAPAWACLAESLAARGALGEVLELLGRLEGAPAETRRQVAAAVRPHAEGNPAARVILAVLDRWRT